MYPGLIPYEGRAASPTYHIRDCFFQLQGSFSWTNDAYSHFRATGFREKAKERPRFSWVISEASPGEISPRCSAGSVFTCRVLALQSHQVPGRCTQERDLVLGIIHVFMEDPKRDEHHALGQKLCTSTWKHRLSFTELVILRENPVSSSLEMLPQRD